METNRSNYLPPRFGQTDHTFTTAVRGNSRGGTRVMKLHYFLPELTLVPKVSTDSNRELILILKVLLSKNINCTEFFTNKSH